MKEVLIIGSGLAGLSAGIELTAKDQNVTLLERHKIVGGRTSDWVADGMHVESGLHRWLGFYKAVPQLFKKAGLDHEDAVIWEDELQIRLPDGGPQAVLGLAPVYNPIETITGFLGNNDLLSPSEKAMITYFFTAGLVDYNFSRAALDEISVRDYAYKRGVSDEAITNLLNPLTEGIFFLPPERYSTMVLIGLLVPAVKRPHTIRVGSFSGGMTNVMCGPISESLIAKGGKVRTEAEVERLAVEDGRVIGVYVNGEKIGADHVVLATSLAPAQRLVREALGDHPWFRKMLRLPSMPAVTLQIELDQPALPKDHVVFSPNTLLVSYAEQSRTTFRGVPGRLSINVAKAEKYIDKAPETILSDVIQDMNRLGIDIENSIRQYRVVTHPEDFYMLEPGYEKLRPPQATPVPGLTLAGDYTKQSMFCSMEGAVISGQSAAKAVLKELA
ncbi:MAG: FAD-dependent oxidoreductase [Chloroflexota bacterium]|jgi:15-cis-phytoene desaturase